MSVAPAKPAAPPSPVLRCPELDDVARSYLTARRPDIGTKGLKIPLSANFFKIVYDKLAPYCYHYDVVVDPEVKVKKVVRLLVAELERHGKFGGIKIAHDGFKNIFTAKRLADTTLSFEGVSLPPEPGAAPSGKDRSFTVGIKFAAEVPLYEAINSYLNGRTKEMPRTAMQALDVVMMHTLASTYRTRGRCIYFPEQATYVGGGAEVWQGNFISVRPTMQGLSLNVDVAATAFVTPGRLVSYLEERLFNGRAHFPPPNRAIDTAMARRIATEMRGLRVQVTHRGSIKRKYRIAGSAPAASQIKFTDSAGRETTVEEYFKKTYNITLRFPNLPCANVGKPPGKDIYLPLEVLDVVSQPFGQMMNTEQRTKMIGATTQEPQTKLRTIMQSVPLKQLPADGVVKAFGLQISTQMAQVQGRVLDGPALRYRGRGGQGKSVVRPQGGVWDLKESSFIVSRSITNWLVLNFTSEQQLSRQRLGAFMNGLDRNVREKGIQTPGPPQVLAGDPRQVEGSLMKLTTMKKPDMLLCVLESARSPAYDVIKRVCETHLGLVTQCLDASKVGNEKVGGAAYQVNVSMKINTKLGGHNLELDTPLPKISQKPTIVLGADVTHPPPSDTSRPSIAAVVGSLDVSCVRYDGVVRAQEHHREDIAQLGAMVEQLLRSFEASVGRKAERIVMYRDGVGESMVDMIARTELRAIRTAYNNIYGTQCPVAFINVQKRNHCRLFPGSQAAGDRKGNLRAGTVVDTVITHPTIHDFFLCSHAGLKGTSRPTHYLVWFDDLGYTADEIQELTNRLCYVYAACTRAISMPTPAYYADLLAERARKIGIDAGKTLSPKLARTVFYC